VGNVSENRTTERERENRAGNRRLQKAVRENATLRYAVEVLTRENSALKLALRHPIGFPGREEILSE
jgi:hypothetical protein